MTWRIIESDLPKMDQLVWVVCNWEVFKTPILWNSYQKGCNWTHWSPCNPPDDLPPAPKTAFEEWYDSLSPEMKIELDETTTYDACERGFKSGYEAGKAKG